MSQSHFFTINLQTFFTCPINFSIYAYFLLLTILTYQLNQLSFGLLFVPITFILIISERDKKLKIIEFQNFFKKN
jgi:hypothetical protein